jgi:hypothetical protein
MILPTKVIRLNLFSNSPAGRFLILSTSFSSFFFAPIDMIAIKKGGRTQRPAINTKLKSVEKEKMISDTSR